MKGGMKKSLSPTCDDCGLSLGSTVIEAWNGKRYCYPCGRKPERAAITGRDVFGKSAAELIASVDKRLGKYPGVDGKPIIRKPVTADRPKTRQASLLPGGTAS